MSQELKSICSNADCQKESTSLKTCSRCQSVQYCDTKCQHNDFERHKEDCKFVRRQIKRLDAETKFIYNHCKGMDPFEEYLGTFWDVWELRTYCHERFLLGRAHLKVGLKNKSRSGIERAKFHYQELLRLTSGDNQGINNHFPFVLLALGNLRDVHEYMYHFDEHMIANMEENVKGSKVGDWVYPESGQHYTECPMFSRRCSCLVSIINCATSGGFGFCGATIFLALLFSQILIVREREEHMKEFSDALRKELKKKKVNPFMVSEITKDLKQDKEMIGEMRERLNTYASILDMINPWVLRSIVNPEPLLTQKPEPESWSDGTPEQAYLLLFTAYDVFKLRDAVKDVKQILLNINPDEKFTYDPKWLLNDPKWLNSKPKRATPFGGRMCSPLIITPTWNYGNVSAKVFDPNVLIENQIYKGNLGIWDEIRQKSDEYLEKEKREEEEERARHKAEKEERRKKTTRASQCSGDGVAKNFQE